MELKIKRTFSKCVLAPRAPGQQRPQEKRTATEHRHGSPDLGFEGRGGHHN